MRKFGRVWIAVALSVATTALADPNDFQVYRLGMPSPSNPGSNASFTAFARELGAAITSSNLMAPGTLGHAGWNVALELSTVSLSAAEDKGGYGFPTDAPQSGFYMPTERQGFASRGPWLMPAIHIRKGLPFSFEVGVKAAWLDKSSMGAGTFEARWAVNEGFALLPDVCIRGYVTRLFNTRDFDLTAGGFDLSIGKRFAVGGMVTFTPYVGWNLTFVGAQSHVVDFDPGRSYADSVATPYAQLSTDSAQFDEVKAGENTHNRFYVGVRFIGGPIQLGVEYSYAGLGSVDYGGGSKYALPGVSAFNATAGLDF